MNLKELLSKLFTVCLDEEYGSTEHITEHINCDDLIEFTKNSNDDELKELGKLFKKLKKSYENGDDNETVREQLKRLTSPRKYELIDGIINLVSSKQENLTVVNDYAVPRFKVNLKGKFSHCLVNIDYKSVWLFEEEDWPLDEDDYTEKDLEYVWEKIKESIE